MNTYLIQSVYHSPAGIAVTVCIEGGEKPETAELLLSSELWQWGRLTAGTAVSEEDFAGMEHAALISRARARTREILSYAGQSRASLLQKLRHHGLPEEICEETADWAVEQRLIREDEQTLRAAEIYHRRKYWGRKRIAAELAAKGYGAEAIKAAAASIPDGEYARALRLIIEKKFGEIPDDPAERQKMVLSLLRLGYTGQEIKDAIEELTAEK